MATKTNDKVSDRLFYALVANIPPSFHSSDLRRFFATFIENDGFECFHYKHRPEGQGPRRNSEDVLSSSDLPKDVGCKRTKNRSDSNINRNCCCIVKIKETKYNELVQLYHGKHWINKNGESLRLHCFISKIKVRSRSETDTDSNINKITDANQQSGLEGGDEDVCQTGSNVKGLSETDLNQLQELRPPHIMPHGNVGTPSKVFLELIKQCQLPAKVIANLGLVFPKSRSKAIYSNVMHNYGENSKDAKGNTKKLKSKLVSSKTPARGNCDTVIEDDAKGEETSDESKAAQDRVFKGDSAHDTTENTRLEPMSSESEEDADDCEEWERHEALHDDPANMERNKERKYEEELEVVWEKGGPGLVWYTDEQYWRENDGDFDEQTADDWDVDMSVYYDPYGGDKDARDMVTMRRDARRRQGHTDKDDIDAANPERIGHFEKYTKGIGRRVLEKHGWSEGAGLGSTVTGMAYALDNDGQKPTDKTGFGYHGEKLSRYAFSQEPKRRRRGPDDVIISTIYDKPEDMEIPDRLLRRRDPKTISYRKNIDKWKPE